MPGCKPAADQRFKAKVAPAPQFKIELPRQTRGKAIAIGRRAEMMRLWYSRHMRAIWAAGGRQLPLDLGA